MPARGSGSYGVNPHAIQKAAAKRAAPARKTVTFKPSQVPTPENRLGRLQATGSEHPAHPKTPGGRTPAVPAKERVTYRPGELSTGGVTHIPGPGVWLNSAKNLVEGVPAGVFLAGKALATGDTKTLGKIAESIPHALLHPDFEHDPVGTLAMLGGPESAVGRGLGDLGRAAGIADAAAGGSKVARAIEKVASTERAGVPLYNGAVLHREWSPDVFRKAAQQTGEAIKHTLPGKTQEFFNNRQVQKAVVGGAVKPGAVDLTVAGGEAAHKMMTAEGEHFLNTLYKGGESGIKGKLKGREPLKHPEVVGMIGEGTVRRPATVRADLEGRRRSLILKQNTSVDGRRALDNEELRQNRLQVKRIDAALADKTWLKNPKPEFEAARTIAEHQAPLTEQKIAHGLLEPNQRNVVYHAIAHEHGEELGRGKLTFVQKPGPHPILKDRAAAQKAVTEARKDVIEKKRGLARAEGRTAGVKATAPAGTKAGYKVAPHWKAAVEEAKAKLLNARQHYMHLDGQVQEMKAAGHISPRGHMYPHFQDALGNRVDTHELAELFHRETEGRKPIFISHKEFTPRTPLSVKAGTRTASTAKSRTGVHYTKGAYDNSWDAIRREFKKASRDLASHQTENQLAHRFYVGHRDGRWFSTEAEAQRVANNLNKNSEGKLGNHPLGQYQPVAVGPEKVLTKTGLSGREHMLPIEQHGVAEYKAAVEQTGKEKYAIAPQKVLERVKAHRDTAEEIATSGLRKYTNYWRHAALYTSVRWPIGTTQENAIRLAFHGVSPLPLTNWTRQGSRSYRIGEKWVHETRSMLTDPHVAMPEKLAAREHLGSIGLGNMVGSVASTALHGVNDSLMRESRTFADALNDGTDANALVKTWAGYRGWVGHNLQIMETNARTAAVGKVIQKEQGGFFRSWRGMLKEQDKLVHDYAHSVVKPEEAERFTRKIIDSMGNWNHLTPKAKKAQQTWSPFGLWWLNSAKFVLKTLPVEHPMATALVAAMVEGTGANRDVPGLPEFLQGTVNVDLPFVGKVNLNPAHYSPFDIAHEPALTAGSMVYPQAAEPVERALGIDPQTHEAIRSRTEKEENHDAWWQSIVRGAEVPVEGVVPGIRTGMQIAREGGTEDKKGLLPWDTKEGTKQGFLKGLAKVAAPVPYTVDREGSSTPSKRGKLGGHSKFGSGSKLKGRSKLGSGSKFK